MAQDREPITVDDVTIQGIDDAVGELPEPERPPRYTMEQLVDKVFIIRDLHELQGDKAPYYIVTLEGGDGRSGTVLMGRDVVVAKLRKVEELGLLPVRIKVVAMGKGYNIVSPNTQPTGV